MNKILAEIIAGVIPFTLSRQRWRGILRYGIFKALKLKKLLKEKRDVPPKYYLAVCAIAKNEGEYFPEWIEWHKSLGVEKFYIYDNDSTDNTREILAPYIETGLVEYSYFPGKKRQLPAYDDCLERHRFEARWIAIIDLDEFIVPVKDKSLPDFLKRLEEFPAVEINWLIYGSGGARRKKPGKVMERFKHHSHPDHYLNRRTKTIFDPRRVFNMIGCHEVAQIAGHIVDSHGNQLKVKFRDRPPQHDVIRINHYPVKSYEEFIEKKKRGRARTHKVRDLNYFIKYDLNDCVEGL
jgi:cellulose synthase/poly-beta-1,6-N-acetylglucosamine synthase-like glycosyltransferase